MTAVIQMMIFMLFRNTCIMTATPRFVSVGKGDGARGAPWYDLAFEGQAYQPGEARARRGSGAARIATITRFGKLLS
jgi:hypothetical protein